MICVCRKRTGRPLAFCRFTFSLKDVFSFCVFFPRNILITAAPNRRMSTVARGDEDMNNNDASTSSFESGGGDSNVATSQPPPIPSACEVHWINNNKLSKILVTMSRGLHDDKGADLSLNIAEEPWAKLKKQQLQAYKPSRADWSSEVRRRYVVMHPTASKEEGPRPASWNVGVSQKWLDEHPVSAAEDVNFLIEEIRRDGANCAADIATVEDEMESSGKHWVGNYPALRLIHCITDVDSIKRAYIDREKIPMGRLHLENRNSDLCEDTVWDMIADKFNDPTFNPDSEVCADMHSDYKKSFVIAYEQVKDMQVATPDQCMKRITSMIVDLKRIIGRWEQSGQGHGGTLTNDDPPPEKRGESHAEFGTFVGRTPAALDKRSEFINKRATYIGYFWHVMVKHDLLKTSLQRLSDAVSATNGALGVPSVLVARASVETDEAGSLGSKATTGTTTSTVGGTDPFQIVASLSKSISKLSQQNEQNRLTEDIKFQREKELSQAKLASNERQRMTTDSVSLRGVIVSMRSDIGNLKKAKRSLEMDKLKEEIGGKNAKIIRLYDCQLQDIEKDLTTMEEDLRRFQDRHDAIETQQFHAAEVVVYETPRRSNRTPDSSIPSSSRRSCQFDTPSSLAASSSAAASTIARSSGREEEEEDDDYPVQVSQVD